MAIIHAETAGTYVNVGALAVHDLSATQTYVREGIFAVDAINQIVSNLVDKIFT